MNYEELKTRIFSEEAGIDESKPSVLIGMGTCGRAAGAVDVMQAFKDEIDDKLTPDAVNLMEVGCLGLCYAEPLVEVRSQGVNVLYQGVQPKLVPDLVVSHVVKGTPVDKQVLALTGTEKYNGYPMLTELPVFRQQQRVTMRNCGYIDPKSIHQYVSRGGYNAFLKALEMDPEEIIDCVKKSLLRGRGGAGFLTGLKWELCRKNKGNKHYIICNGDEGDPGAFMDRSLMEGDPHSVVEGMLIGALAIGADEGFLYARGEYPLAIENLTQAIESAKKYGLLGNNILGRDFSFSLRLVRNAGAFVSGEETALMQSIEGSVAEPRPRPPFPAEAGVFDEPTCINNVETWSNVPQIIEKGAEWFQGIGAEKNGGTKLFSLAGKVVNTGLIEIPMGTPLRNIIYEVGGGIPNGKEFKAIQTGGPAGGCIPASLLDLNLTFEGLNEAGAIMGSGGMIVLDNETCMVDVAKYFLEFTTAESCGKCTPCREGNKIMLEMLEQFSRGEGTEADLETLERLAHGVKNTSLCGLGQNSPNPVITTLRFFRDEYLEHVNNKKCPAGVCKDLITFYIDPELCDGCGTCRKNCPVEAISGEKKQVHTLDATICTRCGICREGCKPNAIYIV